MIAQMESQVRRPTKETGHSESRQVDFHKTASLPSTNAEYEAHIGDQKCKENQRGSCDNLPRLALWDKYVSSKRRWTRDEEKDSVFHEQASTNRSHASNWACVAQWSSESATSVEDNYLDSLNIDLRNQFEERIRLTVWRNFRITLQILEGFKGSTAIAKGKVAACALRLTDGLHLSEDNVLPDVMFMTIPLFRIPEMAELLVAEFVPDVTGTYRTPPRKRVVISKVHDHVACERLMTRLSEKKTAQPNDSTNSSDPESSNQLGRSNGESSANIEKETTDTLDICDSPRLQPMASRITALCTPGYGSLPMQRRRLRHLCCEHASRLQRLMLLLVLVHGVV